MQINSRSYKNQLCPRWLLCFRLIGIIALVSLPVCGEIAGDTKVSFLNSPLFKSALDKQLSGVSEIVFCVRLKYDDPHWYANISYYCDNEKQKAYAGNGKPDIGRLYKLNIRTGQLTTLVNDPSGTIRDPQIHYDGKKVLFAWRKNGTDYFNLYEINIDGTGLRRITHGEFDDYEPTYLPNGDIIFVSTRCKRWVNCWMTQVGIMYRCGPHGQNIRPVSSNTEHDNTPWVMPDGRILYTRWEYVDRSQVEFHHLWTMNPDGTGQTIFYGNMHPNIVMIDAKPVPGTDLVVASFSPGHGVNEHAGIATFVSSELGPDAKSAAKPLHKGRLIRDPYAITADCIIAARDREFVILDGKGNIEPFYVHNEPDGVHEPRPVMPRPREPIIPDRVQPDKTNGYFVLANIYEGRNLSGIKKGEIKKLLVLESLPKPVNFSGGPDLISWLGTFTLERVLGTVPVEEDGSAYFEAPAGRQLFFVALDEKELSMKRMQSFTTVMPGEVLGCVGCHEPRAKTSGFDKSKNLMALKRRPSKIAPFAGFPDVIDYNRDIQPIFDKHCVKCHSYEKREGKIILAGDLGPTWSHSYYTLFANLLVADGRNGLGNQPPRSIGSSASRILKLLYDSKGKLKVSEREYRLLWLWIESGATYAGSYAALRNEAEQILACTATGMVLSECSKVFSRRCNSCHKMAENFDKNPPPLPYEGGERRNKVNRPTAVYERIVFTNDPIARFSANILINFSRPHLSPLLLGPLSKTSGGFGSCGDVFKDTNDPDYQFMLQAIKRGKERIDSIPRYATAAFKPNPQYIREMKRFGILPQDFDISKQSVDIFELDQRYWSSLWWKAQEHGIVLK